MHILEGEDTGPHPQVVGASREEGRSSEPVLQVDKDHEKGHGCILIVASWQKMDVVGLKARVDEENQRLRDRSN